MFNHLQKYSLGDRIVSISSHFGSFGTVIGIEAQSGRIRVLMDSPVIGGSDEGGRVVIFGVKECLNLSDIQSPLNPPKKIETVKNVVKKAPVIATVKPNETAWINSNNSAIRAMGSMVNRPPVVRPSNSMRPPIAVRPMPNNQKPMVRPANVIRPPLPAPARPTRPIQSAATTVGRSIKVEDLFNAMSLNNPNNANTQQSPSKPAIAYKSINSKSSPKPPALRPNIPMIPTKPTAPAPVVYHTSTRKENAHQSKESGDLLKLLTVAVDRSNTINTTTVNTGPNESTAVQSKTVYSTQSKKGALLTPKMTKQ